MATACRVDFYVLARPTQSPAQLACILAMKAWGQGHRITVCAGSDGEARDIDELMWDYPAGRFLPHSSGNDDQNAPVHIVAGHDGIPADRDLVINLSKEPLPQPARFARLVEIVPAEDDQRTASREKYRIYRDDGLDPEHITIE